MAQKEIWENEYRNSKLVTKEDKPQSDVLKFIKVLKKSGVYITGLKILDLGSGTGRNSNYFAELGNEVVGIEISRTAIRLAEKRAQDMGVGLRTKYLEKSIGELFPFDDEYFDMVLDITSSNSLNEKEREVYLAETKRVLKSNGIFFFKGLCKDGDKNAQNLLKLDPGPEYDTYIIKEMNLTERVFSKDDLVKLYGKYFKIEKLEKKTNYSRFNNRSYKRNFWIAVLKK